MRINYYFLFLFIFLLISCGENHKPMQHDPTYGNSFIQDTIEINTIIRQAAARKFENEDSGLNRLTFAEKLSDSLGYFEGLGRSLYYKGNNFYVRNMYKKALECYNRSLDVAINSGNTLLHAQSLERSASVYLSIGDDHLALKLYYEALPLFEQINNKEGIAAVYNIIGVSKTSQEKYDTALSYFRKAMELNEETGNQAGLIHNNGNLAFMYHKMGDTQKAKEVYLCLVPKLIETNDSINLSVVYYHLSMFSEALEQPDSMVYYLNKSLSVSEKIANTSLLVTLYGKKGQIYLERGQYDSASLLLSKSAEMSKAINDFDTQNEVLKLLISIDTIEGNFKKATERFVDMLIATDSAYRQRARNNLEASELSYENQKKSNLIEIQKLELASAKKLKWLFLFLFLLLLATSILLMGLVILFKRNDKKKQELMAEKLKINELQLENIKHTEEINKLKIEKIEREIKIKEHEQVSNALALEQKNELLGIINKKFTEAMQDTGSISLSELNGLVSTIKSQVRDSNDIDLFNQKFNQLHQNFYSNLQQSHPNLTRTELKFCAYLKLNLSGSQIASIQNVTPEAIRKTRYRIRKKFNLSTSESLEDYISRF